MERTHESLTVARELAQAHTLSVALFWAAWLHQYRREGPLTQERAEACLALATEHGLAPNVALGTILRGGALAAQGQGEIGIAHLRQGVAAWRAARVGGRSDEFSCLPGRSVWVRRADHRRAARTGRGPGVCTRYGRALVGGGTVSAQGRATTNPPSLFSYHARRVFVPGARDRPPPAGQVAGATGCYEPEPAVAAPGQARRRPRAAGTDLRLVHRGL
jgi:hypothetical protein